MLAPCASEQVGRPLRTGTSIAGQAEAASPVSVRLTNALDPLIRRVESGIELRHGRFGDPRDPDYSIEVGVDLGVGLSGSMDQYANSRAIEFSEFSLPGARGNVRVGFEGRRGDLGLEGGRREREAGGVGRPVGFFGRKIRYLLLAVLGRYPRLFEDRLLLERSPGFIEGDRRDGREERQLILGVHLFGFRSFFSIFEIVLRVRFSETMAALFGDAKGKVTQAKVVGDEHVRALMSGRAADPNQTSHRLAKEKVRHSVGGVDADTQTWDVDTFRNHTHGNQPHRIILVKRGDLLRCVWVIGGGDCCPNTQPILQDPRDPASMILVDRNYHAAGSRIRAA